MLHMEAETGETGSGLVLEVFYMPLKRYTNCIDEMTTFTSSRAVVSIDNAVMGSYFTRPASSAAYEC